MSVPPQTPPPSQKVENLILQHMAGINRLCLKAFNSNSQDALVFTILNDTVHAIRYDRAVLWDFTSGKAKLLGVSGQTDINKDAKLTKQWEALTNFLIDPAAPQKLDAASFTDGGYAWNAYSDEARSNVIWLPIFSQNELVLGLWLEGFGQHFQESSIQETLKFLNEFLTPSYGAAWSRFYKKPILGGLRLGRNQIGLIAISALAFLLLVRVPLRVVAPCEVVANNPIVVTAPLEGIIEKIDVEPGQAVKKGDLLYEYDKRLPSRNLAASQKELEILEEGVKRAKTLGLTDPKSLTELSILTLKLEKERVNLGYVQWQTTQLDQKATIGGVVMIENPDQWRGKPVKIGEKIMSINNPQDTKVKIWIPEDDNIILDPEKPAKIILNINPSHSYEAHLEFVATEASLSDLHIPSFLAEAKWITRPEDEKLGLQGTAVLYGEKVSLFYYLIRKPLAALRHKIGL